jgi:hypothetical protein
MQGPDERESDVAQADDPADGRVVFQLRQKRLEVACVVGGIGDEVAPNGLDVPG